MTRILILGANGRLTRNTTRMVIEASDLDDTILRPGWFTNGPAGPYTITYKGEPFKGHDISIDSLAGLVAKIVTTPDLHVRESIGVSDR